MEPPQDVVAVEPSRRFEERRGGQVADLAHDLVGFALGEALDSDDQCCEIVATARFVGSIHNPPGRRLEIDTRT